MGAAATPSGEDRKRVRQLLATAQRYAVVEPRGKRIGAFIELVGDGAEGIAIRQDGVFLWRRRVLPITMVAKVIPEQRAVVLTVDRRALERANGGSTSVAGTSHSGDEDAAADRAWQERIARYVSVSDVSADRDGGDGERPVEAKRLERPSTSAAQQPAVEPRRSNQQTEERHLLFVSTSRGYHLVERDGPPPPLFRDVTVPEHEGLFRVVKVAASPLPHDSRLCAYLEQTG